MLKAPVVPLGGTAPAQLVDVNEMPVTVAVSEWLEFVKPIPVANVCLEMFTVQPVPDAVTLIDVGVVSVMLNDVAPALVPTEAVQSNPVSPMVMAADKPKIVAVHFDHTTPVTGIESVDLLAGVIEPVSVQSLHWMKKEALSVILVVPVVVSEIFVLSAWPVETKLACAGVAITAATMTAARASMVCLIIVPPGGGWTSGRLGMVSVLLCAVGRVGRRPRAVYPGARSVSPLSGGDYKCFL